MPKLQVNLLLVSKFLSSCLKVQFNLHECIVGDYVGEAIIITLCEGNLCQIHFQGAWSGCNQFVTTVNKRMYVLILASPTLVFECEEYSCIPKHGE